MTTVLLISHDIMGSRMAGPGIRNAGLAKALKPHCDLRIAAPVPSESTTAFTVQLYKRNNWESIQPYLSAVDVVIANGDSLAEFPQIGEQDCCIVVDSYDPHTAENLLWQQEISQDPIERWHAYDERREILFAQCRLGDFLICASEVQRDWLLGVLESQGRLNPWTLADDPSFRRLIDIVPYGLPTTPFEGEAIEIEGVTRVDKVLLWGGGVWPWLDAETAVRAMPGVLEHNPNTRLLFPGTRHPNPAVPAIRAVDELKNLTAKLKLDEHVLFGDWVAREEWPSYLARADIGLSLHPDTIETHLAYRSRLFEYIWAGLPMIVSAGDATSTLVDQYDLGYVTAVNDVDAVTTAILSLLEKSRSSYAPHFEVACTDFTWEKAVKPLIRYLEAPYRAPDKQALAQGVQLNQSVATQTLIAELHAERDRALSTIRQYEQGRFMRFMRWLGAFRERMQGRR